MSQVRDEVVGIRDTTMCLLHPHILIPSLCRSLLPPPACCYTHLTCKQMHHVYSIFKCILVITSTICLLCCVVQTLSTKQLSHEQCCDHAGCDVLTGFQLVDGSMRLFVLEGPAAGQGMSTLVMAIAR